MALTLRGVMQSTVTPLKDDFSPDLLIFEKLVQFHVRAGATAIGWPHHKAESLNLTIRERKRFAKVAVKVTNRRVPVSIHVSALAVEDTLELARHGPQLRQHACAQRQTRCRGISQTRIRAWCGGRTACRAARLVTTLGFLRTAGSRSVN